MAEYIACDRELAEKRGIEPGSYHAFRWLDVCKYSAHKVVTPTGAVIQCRDDFDVAWHALGFNQDTLGIEFLVPGEHTYGSFLEAMKTDYLTIQAYNAGLEQILAWLERYDIAEIVGHRDVDPRRKHDPGDGFPMADLARDLERRRG